MKTSLFSSHIRTKSTLLTSKTYSQTSIPNLTPNLTLEPHTNIWNIEDSQTDKLSLLEAGDSPYSYLITNFMTIDNKNDLYKLFTAKIASGTASKRHNFLCLVNIWFTSLFSIVMLNTVSVNSKVYAKIETSTGRILFKSCSYESEGFFATILHHLSSCFKYSSPARN